MGSLVDITDNFEELNRFVIIGDTPTEAFLEKFVGFLGGFSILAIGLVRWIPSVQRLSDEIAERTRAEKALMESEARLRAVFDNTPVCMNLKDIEGRYLLANKRYEEWWGCSVEEAIGKKSHEFQGDGFRVDIHTAAEQIVLETGKAYESEIRIQRPQDNGQIYDRLLIKFPVKSSDGTITALGTVAVDITDRKRAEQLLKQQAEELKQALAREKELNKLQREFVSMASHEFRTPLAIIDATAQRMKRRADKNQLTPEDAAQRVEKIRDAVQRMTRLMESTLDAASMEEGKIKVEIKPCDICKVVREVCSRQQEIAQTHIISCDLADLPVTIQADTGSLEQVLNNLLSNAVKYAPDAPDIEVKAHTEDDQVVISVHDHGIGIDEDELGRIGERFFRARTSTGTAGTGIGLNLAKTLVEIHGGTVSVASQKGEGSTFTIRLPIAGPDQSEKVDTKVA
jgi:PAS domain S-box-containing protein